MLRLTSVSKILKGGEMMKTLGLVLALTLVIGGGVVAANQQIDVYTGWNLVASPVVPFDPTPVDFFSPVDIEFDGGVQRWDATSGRMVAYDFLEPEAFGNILLGDGYWLNTPYADTITVNGVPDGVPDAMGNMTDMWVSLPGNQLDGVDAGGWQLIGHPFDHTTPMTSDGMASDIILVTDGTKVVTLEEAEWVEGWLNGTFQYWDGAMQRMMTAGAFLADDDTLRPGHGYWVQTYRDNLALIIPANVQ